MELEFQLPGVVWIPLKGSLTDFDVLKDLELDIKQAVHQADFRLAVLDMTQVSAIISLAIGVLIRAAKIDPERIVLYGLNSELHKQFKEMQLHQVFKFCYHKDEIQKFLE